MASGGNTIAFPQAKVELCRSSELPAPPDEALRFMAETVVIAMAGTDVEDLHEAMMLEARTARILNSQSGGQQLELDSGFLKRGHD